MKKGDISRFKRLLEESAADPFKERQLDQKLMHAVAKLEGADALEAAELVAELVIEQAKELRSEK